MEWTKISLILCMFGALKEFRPNEPFIYDYLTGPWKNFTGDQVTQEIYPVGTYCNLATLVVVFLMTDFLRYKPVIIICGLSGIITYIIIILGKTLTALQVVEFFYGLYVSSEVAYYTYIYAKVHKDHYQVVSSYTRSAILFGRFITGIISQLTVTFDLLDYHQLNYLTVFGQVLATIWALFLPAVGQSVYFHRRQDSIENNDPEQHTSLSNSPVVTSRQTKKSNFIEKIRQAYYLLWKDFIKAYTNNHVLKWSLWWAAATCGYLQVVNYAQSVWQTCVSRDEKIYNAAVESFYTIIGALAVFGVGKLKLNWALTGEILLSTFSFVEAILLFIMTKSYNIWLQYVLYVTFGVVYHTIVTVASFEVAKNISDDSFGLVFGLNTFMALAFESILTLIVTSGNVLVLDIRSQFAIYSGYFGILGIIFMVMAIFTITTLWKKKEKIILWSETKISDT